MPGGSRVLVIDDEVLVLNLLGMLLQEDGFEVLTAASGERGLELARLSPPDAVILDIKMPGMDGFEVCRRLRQMTDAAILFVSVKGDSETIVRALYLGGDDYVVKPYTYDELASRLTACLRRREGYKPAPRLRASGGVGLLLDASHRLVFVKDGRSVQLTPKEFELLRLLVANRGRVLSADAILTEVWGPRYVGERDLVKQFIHRLRLKLEPDPTEPRSIVTIRGSGYSFEEETRPGRRQLGELQEPPGRPAYQAQPAAVHAPSGPGASQVLTVPNRDAPSPTEPGSHVGQVARQRPVRHAWAWGAAIGFVLALLAATGMASASGSALPGDALYPVKTCMEGIRLALTFGDTRQAQLHLEFAGERLEEAASLLLQGRPEGIPDTMAAFEAETLEITRILARVAVDRAPQAFASVLEEATVSHGQLLQDLMAAAPEDARPGIDHAQGVLSTESEAIRALFVQGMPMAPPGVQAGYPTAGSDAGVHSGDEDLLERGGPPGVPGGEGVGTPEAAGGTSPDVPGLGPVGTSWFLPETFVPLSPDWTRTPTAMPTPARTLSPHGALAPSPTPGIPLSHGP
jgi:DNA-binding response OmpR family regulator